MIKIFTLKTIILLLIISSMVFASMPKFFSTSSVSVVENAKQENTMLSENNAISLSPETTVVTGIEEPNVWKLFAKNDGALFAATGGDKGRVYRMNKNEKSFTKIIEIEEKNITSVFQAKDGKIYVSAANEGYIYIYGESLMIEKKLKLSSSYVWDMAESKDGLIYIAAGGKEAKIYTLDKKQNIKELITMPTESHVMTLYYDEKGDFFYAGTEGNGLLVKFFKDGKYSVIYDTGEKEVHSVVVDKIGNVYFGTANREKNDMLETILFGMQGDKQKSFRNSIYKSDEKGAVQRIFYLSQILVFTLAKDSENNIYFATGDKSSLYRIDEQGSLLYVANFDGKSIVSSASADDYIYFASKTGEVYKMSKTYSKTGTFTSDVLDAKMLSRFGSVDYIANIPNGGSIKIETRTGNISKADKSWSEFVEVDSNGKIKSPAGRFIQYRILFTSKDAKDTPVVTSMNISYISENLAPDVFKGRLLTPYLQSKVDVEAYKKPALKPNEGMLIWTGSDPNGDTLTYSAEYKMKNEKTYRKFVNNIRENYFIFEAVTLPSGIYDFKITASDYLDNGIEETKEKTFEYQNAKYDLTPPYVKDIVFTSDKSGLKKARFTVIDDLSMLQSVRITTFGNIWRYITPEDTMIDGKSEIFSVVIEDKNAESITIEVADNEGNTAYYSYIIK